MGVIEINNLSKVIRKKEVLKEISFSFEEKKIYGIWGRNASGKTMLLRAIAGLIRPTKGEVLLQGKRIHKDMSFPEGVGLIIENCGMLSDLTGYENLRLLAKIKKVATKEDIRSALERVGLDPDDKRRIRAYSLGMKQKLAIAQAIFEKPNILLLDEPTNALDEESIKQIRNLLLEEKERGCTILVASHNKEDIEFLSDEVLLMSDGRLSRKETE